MNKGPRSWNPGRRTVWTVGVMGIVAIGAIDYASGTELRLYPLYYGPLGLLAWYAGRAGALAAAALCAASWLGANQLAGMRFSSPGLWAANTAVHASSFLFVGLLLAALSRALAEAHEMSRTDPLTSLRTRGAFHQDSVPLLALCRRAGRPVTVAYLDLDDFKDTNDRRGHEAGDALLREVAHAIRDSIRPSDLCARFGGDEFALLLPEIGDREAAAALERVRVKVKTAAARHQSGVTASIGAVTCPAATADLEDLMRQADRLMYAAKAAGRNRVTLEVRPLEEAAAVAAPRRRPGRGD